MKVKLAEKAKDVEKALRDYLVIREPKKLYEAMAHIPLAGGKRLRPVMAQLTCEMVGGDGKKAIPFAASLEVIHNFTLVHDDVTVRDVVDVAVVVGAVARPQEGILHEQVVRRRRGRAGRATRRPR